MRTTVRVLLLLIIAAPAAAQGLPGRLPTAAPTVGVAAGLFGGVDQTPSNDDNPIVSGTMEIPYARHERIRIEAARTRLPLLPDGVSNLSSRIDTAHISRLSVGIAAVGEPGGGVSGYIGAGVGMYRATFDRAPESQRRVGAHVYGGAEMRLSRRVTVDAELGVHLLQSVLRHDRSVLKGETIGRIKIAI